ncbi:MFS transporter [Puerhibacterium puerhi]|jgi:MFS family permease|uniref:MFS transporter n=1 Tax=Puerhibacterium puerhi TaxID=2692623 RepID=UPI00135B00EE|nr:MFS transporter [Puerhibacterium puerhi]
MASISPEPAVADATSTAGSIPAATVGAPAPEVRAGNGLVIAYVAAFFALYIALLTPVMSTLAVKVNALSGPDTRAADLALVTGVGAFFAFVANPLAGALSDRTTSRLGMRRPWLLWGVLAGAVGLAIIAFAPSIAVVVVGWAITQTAFNGTQAALQAVLPDQVGESQRAKVSGWLGIAQNVAPLVGVAIASVLAGAGTAPSLMILLPTALAIVGVVALVAVLKDRRLTKEEAGSFHLGRFVKGFWISPRKHPDFGWAFAGRFMMLFGFALYNNYQLYFMLDRFGFDEPTALSWQLRLMVVQAVVLLVAASLGGYLSDRTGRRKIFVIVSTVLAGAGLVVFAFAGAPSVLYLGAGLFGAGLGAYFAVDLALVTDVLPNRETEAAKNMGVFNIANALPQSLAPAFAPMLLAVGAAAGDNGNNYVALFGIGAVIVILGAVSTMFIKGTK